MQAPQRGLPVLTTSFLGQIVAFTIADRDVHLDQLRARLLSHGLRTDTVKRRIRRIDAFKRATNDIATKFPKLKDHQHGLLVKPVGQDAQESHRLVIYERTLFRAGQRRDVKHETIWRIRYDRDESITVEQQIVPGLLLAAEERAWIAATIGADGAGLQTRFEHHCTHLDSHGVRSFVRGYLGLLGATNVKGLNSGGLYFVPQEHITELTGLALIVRSIGSSMSLIPLLDLPDLRDMVADAFVSETVDEIRGFYGELDRINATPGREVLGRTRDAYIAKADALARKLGAYEAVLHRTLQDTTNELTAFRQEAMRLTGRVRQPRTLERKT